MTTTRTIELSDGRRLGFDDAGDPDASPVLFFHGTPGSRLYWQLIGSEEVDETAAAAGSATAGAAAARTGIGTAIRLISVDRPGLGLSSPEPQRSIGSFAFDIVQLLDSLGIERIGVFGFSGGAGYALAAAAFMPERVTAAALVSPMGDLSVPHLLDSVDGRLRKAISFASESPTARASAVADLLGADRVVRTIADHMWAQLPAADRATLTHVRVRGALERTLQEAARQGIEGARLDIDLMTRKWDFPLEDINVPVIIESGGRDPWAPPTMSDWLLRSLPQARFVQRPTEGHFTMLVRHGGAVLAELVSAMGSEGQPVLGHSDHEAMTSSASAV